MKVSVVKVETENFRGKRPAVQILTLSSSYAEVLGSLGRRSELAICIAHPEGALNAVARVALVHPISAPAVISIPLPGAQIKVGDELTLLAE